MRNASPHAGFCACVSVSVRLWLSGSAEPLRGSWSPFLVPPTCAHALMYIHMMNHHRYLGDAARFKVSRPWVTRRHVKKDVPCAGALLWDFVRQLTHMNVTARCVGVCILVQTCYYTWLVIEMFPSVTTGGAGECSGWWQRPPVEPEAEETGHPSLPQVQQRKVSDANPRHLAATRLIVLNPDGTSHESVTSSVPGSGLVRSPQKALE